MAYSKLSISLAVMLVLIFSMGASCDEGSEQIDSPYMGGHKGLVAEFQEIGSIESSGPENQVWEDESFPVQVELQNKGEHTVPAHEAELEIRGISKSDFSGLDFTKDNSEKIEAVDKDYRPEGGFSYVDFGNAKYNKLEGTHYDAQLFVEYTYPYETHINMPRVCVKGDVKEDGVCDVEGNKKAYASAGPIQAGDAEERIMGRGAVMIEIPVWNAGSGKTKAHKDDEFDSSWDQVYFQVNSGEWECESSSANPNIVRMSREGDGKAKIRCYKEDIPEDEMTFDSVTLKLSYYYKDKINEEVRIKRIPE
ncbi:MAG: hypothetical protein ACOCZ6_02105 [Nanoarchaeota archaeon]